ncbi:alpha/beta hydrolase [Streptomyces lunaelactis]|uniref:alpha/beta fold hydrolase n=1 Tax=Streptomyces lunaelactis TaxID=1535768 RepID=UPI00158497BE|nr:alpha/beta hydrolase [Streptomyces lunaelactis]NUK06175.1 alpha/beta hydrolase [Streptomyces lunaelactis]NUK20788.1 alpha/beta hydrolase [Streptomyces lunaelactis]NUK38092.1 alpha/beta hydrolase [Streptomyces lunaelactis]NUK45425.1 alpha/beta hydrolase [Streptomyces lunaelactis]NUK61503.1 alpha/beta hydrolase [Streptomyces lunaelactis]
MSQPAHSSLAQALDVRHRLVDVPGARIHLVEQGSGPLVLLVHGFPESWYSWRHQLPAIAAAGFRAVAIDVRGYGRSSKPRDVAAYRMLAHVADNVAVVRALGEETAVIVGHDWGSPIAANSALLRPDVFTAVGLLSVPYSPRNGFRPTDAFARIGGTGEFYVSYFQEPGRAEAEIEPDVRAWLAGFYAGLSADTMPPVGEGSLFFVPEGGMLSDHFVGDTLPAWLSESDLDVYAGEFERTGLTGALNRYRNVDRDWEDLAAWDGAPITQPSLFIGGELDASTTWMADAIAAYPTTLPGLVSSHILNGCGHWVQQERSDRVNQLLADWLRRGVRPAVQTD